MFIQKKLHEFQPTSRFFFNVHLDGLEKTHDMAVERDGVFEAAVEASRPRRRPGFLVCTNTTVFKETDMEEIDALFAYLTEARRRWLHALAGLRLRGGVQHQPRRRGRDLPDPRRDPQKFHEAAEAASRSTSMNTSPIYLEFLQGKRELTCTAWGNPTRNVKGWKGPCYLITDEHHETFDGLMNDTNWDKYGYGKDPRCEHCMVHCGYEPSAALGVNARLGDSLKMLMWQLT